MKKTMLIFSLILCLLLTGCDYEAIIDEVVHEVANQLTEPEDVVEPFIGFSETDAEQTDQLFSWSRRKYEIMNPATACIIPILTLPT